MTKTHTNQTEPTDEQHDAGTERIVTGDALKELSELPEAIAHAVVTDPPYGLSFMQRDWDRFTAEEYQDWCRQWAEEAHRVLKPGGYLAAFSSSRTHHRLFTGVENAGFEIRDTVTWHYGNGFPKNSDMFLKPTTEFVVLARKPFEGSAAECHEEHGTAYLNIDACRIDSDRPTFDRGGDSDRNSLKDTLKSSSRTGEVESGRFPGNVIFDEPAAEVLDAVVGELASGGTPASRDGIGSDRVYSSATGQEDLGQRIEHDSGGPSRYFYTSKATQGERTLNGQIENGHPTVKPLDLMEWLVSLVSQEGQVVVDPFCGTGTTCKAAKDLNRRWVGIEQQPQWADVARARCGLSPQDPSHVRSDDGQTGLEEFLDNALSPDSEKDEEGEANRLIDTHREIGSYDRR